MTGGGEAAVPEVEGATEEVTEATVEPEALAVVAVSSVAQWVAAAAEAQDCTLYHSRRNRSPNRKRCMRHHRHPVHQ